MLGSPHFPLLGGGQVGRAGEGQGQSEPAIWLLNALWNAQLIKYSLCFSSCQSHPNVDRCMHCNFTTSIWSVWNRTLWESDLNPGWKIRASLTTKSHRSASWKKLWKILNWIILMICQISRYLHLYSGTSLPDGGIGLQKTKIIQKWGKAEICNLFPPGSCIETSARDPVAWLEACLDIHFLRWLSKIKY